MSTNFSAEREQGPTNQLARKFITLLAKFTMTRFGAWISDVQVKYLLGRPAILLTFIFSCVWLIDTFNPRSTVALIALWVISAATSVLFLGLRFPSQSSRIVGFVGYKKVVIHLLRVTGTKEKRTIRKDLVRLISDAVGAKARTITLTSPVLCRVREAEHVGTIIETALIETGAVWRKEVSEPHAMDAAHSLNFKWCYGDTMGEGEMRGSTQHLLFGRFKTGIQLIPARTITYTLCCRQIGCANEEKGG